MVQATLNNVAPKHGLRSDAAAVAPPDWASRLTEGLADAGQPTKGQAEKPDGRIGAGALKQGAGSN